MSWVTEPPTTIIYRSDTYAVPVDTLGRALSQSTENLFLASDHAPRNAMQVIPASPHTARTSGQHHPDRKDADADAGCGIWATERGAGDRTRSLA